MPPIKAAAIPVVKISNTIFPSNIKGTIKTEIIPPNQNKKPY